MSGFKPGDQIWMGPFDVAGKVGEKLIIGGGSQDEREKIPHSPALANVARWLHDTPQAAEAARKALKHLTTYGFLPPDEQAAMMTLVTALTPPHGASDA